MYPFKEMTGFLISIVNVINASINGFKTAWVEASHINAQYLHHDEWAAKEGRLKAPPAPPSRSTCK